MTHREHSNACCDVVECEHWSKSAALTGGNLQVKWQHRMDGSPTINSPQNPAI
jgi:hypothetical protein